MDQTPTDDARPEWWAEATTPIPAGHITFEQLAALTGYTGADGPTARELTFPLAADTARRCKLLRRPDDAGDPCACGLMFQRFPSCELLRAIDAGGSFRAEDHAGPEACTGLDGRCPECIALYLALVGPTLPVCIPCGHKHWPWQDHADHQWRDECPYEGTACRVGRDEDPIGVHASDGSLAYPDDPMPVNVRALGEPVDLAAEAAEQESGRAWWAGQVHSFRPGPSGACEHRMSDGAICGGRNWGSPIHRGPA